MQNLDKAVDYLQAAAEIFEETGMTAKADQVLKILLKIGQEKTPPHPKNPANVSDRHTKGLTSEKMVANLKDHGSMFNMVDDGAADDLLNIDIDDKGLEVAEGENSYEKTFEDSD